MLRTLCLATLLTACSVQAVPPKAHAQSPRYVIFDQHVRNVLADDWDKHAHDPVIVERAYCITYQKDLWIIPEYIWRVVEIEPAEQSEATPHSVNFRCPDRPNVTALHLHPFQSCLGDQPCADGGTLSMQCFPSDTDVRSLIYSRQPFAAIICARDAIVFYLPPH